MRQIITTRFALLLTILWQTVTPCHAAPTVKTTSHVFPLHFVSWLKDSPIVPAIALKTDFLAYPGLPSYKQFLDAPEDSPERAIVRYIQVLSDGQDDLMLETLSAAKNFYAEEERKERDESITSSIKTDHSNIKKQPDVRLWHRYDAGPLSIISLAFVSPLRVHGVQPFQTIYLRKSGGSYVFTKLQNAPSDRKNFQAVIDGVVLNNIINLNESNLVYWPNLADFPQPAYPYHFSLPTLVPGVSSATNPLELLFTGKVSNVLVDENMAVADPMQALIKRAVRIGRGEDVKEFLSLWTDYDQKGIFARRLALQTARNAPVSDLGFFAGQDQVRLVFTIDFEVGSLVFLRNNDSKKLHLLRVWKQAPDDYRLSETGILEKGDVLPGNLETLFNSSNFQSYVNDQVDQFIKQNDIGKTLQPNPK